MPSFMEKNLDIMQKELQSKARELLESGDVKQVIGYEAGSVASKCTPSFAESPDEIDRLIWNPTCVNNLAVYLPQAASVGKTAVVVKPCDGKSIVELIREKQVKREDVVIISVPCPGVLNADAIDDIDGADIKSVEWADDGLTITTSNGVIDIT